MGYRSYSPSDDSEINYKEKDFKFKEKKRGLSRKSRELHGKSNTKLNNKKIQEEKKRSDGHNSSSKTLSKKESLNRPKQLSEKTKWKNHDSDYETSYRKREDTDYKHSNLGNNLRKHKVTTGRGNLSRESSKQKGFNKKSNLRGIDANKSNRHTKEDFFEDGESIPLTNFDYLDKSGDEEIDRKYYEQKDYDHEEENVPHNYSSSITDENGEISTSEEDVYNPNPKHQFEKEKEIKVVTRPMWDPEPGNPEDDVAPQQPYNHINYLDTSTPMCENQEECIEVLRYLKERDQSMKHNFYIGGDGVIYEGKGWVADVNEQTGYRKRAIDIGFLGTFSAMTPPPTMMVTAYHLVHFGITSEKIIKKFSHDFLMCQETICEMQSDLD